MRVAPKRLADTKSLTREEWLAVRRSGIGGSDAAAIAGMSPWSTALDVYNDKVLGIAKQFDSSAEQRLWIGHEIEPIMRKRFTLDIGFDVEQRHAVFQSARWPVALANIDGWLPGKEAIWECKTTNARNAHHWEHGVPEWYACQVHHYMYVMDVRAAWVTVLIGGQEIRHYEVEYNPMLETLILDAEKIFWKMVEDKAPPKQHKDESSEAYASALKATFQSASSSQRILLPKEFEDKAESIATIQVQIAGLEETKVRLENEIKLAMGPSEIAELPSGKKITWKAQKGRNSANLSELEAHYPEAFKACVSAGTPFRVFRIGGNK